MAETFEQVGRGRWRPTGSFKSFLYTVAHRRCLDLLRRRRTRERLRPRLFVIDREPRAPDDAVALQDDLARLERAMEHLPEANRAALLLYYHHHLSVKEVAAVTNTTVEQVKSKLAYGRRLLRQQLGES